MSKLRHIKNIVTDIFDENDQYKIIFADHNSDHGAVQMTYFVL